MDNIFALLVGLFLGWFFLPTPQWATTTILWLVAKVPFLGKFLKK